jgi:ureidoglycolate lyase
MSDIVLQAEPLSARGFATFGDVIETEGRAWRWINEGTSQRFDDLARIDVLEAEGRPLISIFRASPQAIPFAVRSLERHPLSSQSFIPLDARPFLVIVAEHGDAPLSHRLRAFLSSGRQGVNYHRNTWHHSLIALEQTSNFLVVDRGGPQENCEEVQVSGDTVRVTTPPSRHAPVISGVPG